MTATLTSRAVFIETPRPEATHGELGTRLEGTVDDYPGLEAFVDFVWWGQPDIPGLITSNFTGLFYLPVWSAENNGDSTMGDFVDTPLRRQAYELGASVRVVNDSRLLVARSTSNSRVRESVTYGSLLYWSASKMTDEEVRQIAAELDKVNPGRNGLHEGHALELVYRVGEADLLVAQLWIDADSFYASVRTMEAILAGKGEMMPDYALTLQLPRSGYLLPAIDEPLAYVA